MAWAGRAWVAPEVQGRIPIKARQACQARALRGKAHWGSIRIKGPRGKAPRGSTRTKGRHRGSTLCSPLQGKGLRGRCSKDLRGYSSSSRGPRGKWGST